MNDMKPNSHRYKEEQKQLATNEKKKVEKVISGNAKVRKKSGASKLADVFVSEDVTNVKSYVVMDVLVPALKKLVFDIVTDGIDMILYGSTGHSKKRSNKNSSYVDYRSISSDRRDERRYDRDYASRARYDFGDVSLDSKSEAEDVLASMDELIEQYGMVTVADLYDLIGVSCDYTDNKYGWTNISTASAVRGRDGWTLKLPRVKNL